SPLLSRTIEEHIQKVIQCPAKDKRPQKTFPNTIIRFLMRLPWLNAHSADSSLKSNDLINSG
ncbi:hypothetical protein, partial [Porphyromonas gingivalis]|uniref:hypothetical protein n=1 Tax=Porphyromonas gingivalis TaxID=837 RepID=UPI001C54D776